ncbi:hypothetical protein ACWF76_14900 [Streptomyces globisporus]
MFESSAIPASGSWPASSGLTQTSLTSSPRTSGIISGRGTVPSPSEAGLRDDRVRVSPERVPGGFGRLANHPDDDDVVLVVRVQEQHAHQVQAVN